MAPLDLIGQTGWPEHFLDDSAKSVVADKAFAGTRLPEDRFEQRLELC